MENEVLLIARQKVGAYLKSIREEKELSLYAVGQKSGLAISQLHSIEAGSSSYTFDSFLRVTAALDCYFFLESKEGKHLDFEHMAKKAKRK